MKKNYLKKRVMSLLLALVMMLCVTLSAGATEAPSSTPEGEIELGENDFIVPEAAAAYIAEFFVEDMAGSGNTKWNSETKAVNTVVMYDETGLAPSAYAVELTEGYVVVSAYADVPSLILEWADDGEPVYSEAPLEADEDIIYTSPLDYYVTDGETVETFQGEEVDAEEIPTPLQDCRSEENVNPDLRENIAEEKAAWLEEHPLAAYAAVNTEPDAYITDVFAYAKSVHDSEGKWECTAWKNDWEQYKYNLRDIDLSGYREACGPIAITNILKMYGERYSSTPAMTLNRMSGSEVFHSIEGLTRKLGFIDVRYWSNGGGLDTFTAIEYIQAAFKKYGKNDFELSSPKIANAANVQNTLAYSNKLLFLKLSSQEEDLHPYGSHWVVGYAYNTIKNSASRDSKTFLKICDGRYEYGVNSENRFINTYFMINSEYMEVVF